MTRCPSKAMIIPDVLKRCIRDGNHPEVHAWIEAVRTDGSQIVATWGNDLAVTRWEAVEQDSEPSGCMTTTDDRAMNLAYRVGAATATIGIAADRLERAANRLADAGEHSIELAEILAYMRDAHNELTDSDYDWQQVEARLNVTMGKQ